MILMILPLMFHNRQFLTSHFISESLLSGTERVLLNVSQVIKRAVYWSLDIFRELSFPKTLRLFLGRFLLMSVVGFKGRIDRLTCMFCHLCMMDSQESSLVSMTADSFFTKFFKQRHDTNTGFQIQEVQMRIYQLSYRDRLFRQETTVKLTTFPTPRKRLEPTKGK